MTDAPLWTVREIIAATGAALRGAGEGETLGERPVYGLSFDTRSLAKGDLFIALSGARDGHDFAQAAADKGAAAALLTHRPADLSEALPGLMVDDPLRALEDLARAARQRCFGALVAVTGSVGKTTTKEMLRAALSPLGEVHAAAKSFNNHIGVPISLASLPQQAAFGVFEIGMNHAGEITPLVDLVRPHVAIITSVAAVHLENFSSVDGIADAKAEILSGIRRGGAAVLPSDNPYYERLVSRARECGVERIVPFGFGDGARPGIWGTAPVMIEGGSRTEIAIAGERHVLELGVPGTHQVSNALAVIAAGAALGLDLESMIEGLASFRAGAGRGARHHVTIRGKKVLVLDESYNANPTSMASALAQLGETEPVAGGRRLAVLGEMKELGPTSDALHAGLAGPIEDAGTARVWLAGSGMAPLRDALPADRVAEWAPKAPDLLSNLVDSLEQGDVVLFKGSNAAGIGALLEAFLAKTDRAG
ncbi:hypothetical protein PB2503_09704 [Parvularcula bermudensis HTCC2503]|uniref:UDP-N-acetylmuramoyl-tripeptide--D-alanyl-D-alanine ligase n=1 Tax=Parvularcula bermudensis (strain ATCC BAA-594 / HTCC2503 / KCTC 12087) TaxID=314260 RepID=E0TDS7_PARBH|nr:UDP-N-acetylmuramoyl-tripeptide--D-alanyl-D-alanine ligase [Parvularcula bermudensis]ADM09993.1 hypothetical protein PB2503_09704 [Parvularcula bermudensis HTCC2503]